MNGIARVFPGCHNILCCWHINKNVLANCKTRFSDVEWQEFMQRWNLVVSSTSIELFDVALGAFKETYAASHPVAWNYINNTWLPHKEKFVACFVDEFPHFGSTRGWRETTT
jgi:histone-lysine N-methyltransferase SETD2